MNQNVYPGRKSDNHPNFVARRIGAVVVATGLTVGAVEARIPQHVREVTSTISAAVTGAKEGVAKRLQDSSAVNMPPASELTLHTTARALEGPDDVIARLEPSILDNSEHRYEAEQIIRMEAELPGGVLREGQDVGLPKL